jgi:CBS-domain-containing membrane protein
MRVASRHARILVRRSTAWWLRRRPQAEPHAQDWRDLVIMWLGACGALGILGALAAVSHEPFLIAPFGASVVLLFGQPESPLTQPRNVLGGHVVGGAIGLCAGLFAEPVAAPWIVTAVAVATTLVVMQATRCVHPPAGATAIVCQQSAHSWNLLVAPVLAGALLLVVLATCCHHACARRRYPHQWW